jgi:hypothetical protein
MAQVCHWCSDTKQIEVLQPHETEEIIEIGICVGSDNPPEKGRKMVITRTVKYYKVHACRMCTKGSRCADNRCPICR